MTDTARTPTTAIGSPIRRKEDARLLTGRTEWTDSLPLPGALHLGFVRSPMAHATDHPADIDTARRGHAPGVVDVIWRRLGSEANAKVPVRLAGHRRHRDARLPRARRRRGAACR